MTSYAVVTCFHKAGYDSYGQQMIETFDRFWPRDVRMMAFSEDCLPSPPSPRIDVIDLIRASPELAAFRQRHRDHPAANGSTDRRLRWIFQWHKLRIKVRRVLPRDAYRWQAVRFSHKPFAIFAAAQRCEADVLFWLDSDMVMKTDVPTTFLEHMMPGDAMLSCITRPKFTDCCLIGFNLRHPQTRSFLHDLRDLYVSDRLFSFPEYHDSYLFDVIRHRYERRGCKIHDLSDGAGTTHGHVFAHCQLGRFMDHLKGARKPALA